MIGLLFYNPTVEEKKDLPPPKYKVLGVTATKQEYKEAILEYMGKEMVAVAECEGGLKWGAKGKNVDKKTGKVWSVDENTFQINRKFHYKKALSMGMDIDTVQGHFEYAKYLYDKNGLSDWIASKPCWSKKISV